MAELAWLEALICWCKGIECDIYDTVFGKFSLHYFFV